jgi:hypothetical protein
MRLSDPLTRFSRSALCLARADRLHLACKRARGGEAGRKT